MKKNGQATMLAVIVGVLVVVSLVAGVAVWITRRPPTLAQDQAIDALPSTRAVEDKLGIQISDSKRQPTKKSQSNNFSASSILSGCDYAFTGSGGTNQDRSAELTGSTKNSGGTITGSIVVAVYVSASGSDTSGQADEAARLISRLSTCAKGNGGGVTTGTTTAGSGSWIIISDGGVDNSTFGMAIFVYGNTGSVIGYRRKGQGTVSEKDMADLVTVTADAIKNPDPSRQ